MANLIYIALFLLSIVDAALVYDIRCPERMEKRLLSKRCQNPIQFHCLLSAADGVYKSECRNREWVIKGNYPVRRGFRQYIDYELCPIDTYQPFVFWSSEDHQCSMLKSLCSEEGHLQYDNGTTTSDKRCNCDSVSGYDFAVPPKNKCFCVPSEEDCSCLHKSCNETIRQNTANGCVKQGKNTNIVTMCETIHRQNNIKEVVNSTKQISRLENIAKLKSERRFFPVITILFFTIIFGFMVIMCLVFFILDSRCIKGNERTECIKDKENYPKVKEDLRDIIILHSDEDNYKVAEYIGHLKVLAKEFYTYDITIESFNNVFPSIKTIQLQDIIKHCKFLFIYVSTASFLSNVEIHGINQEEITSVLNMHHRNTFYSSIKTVCATQNSHLILKEIDLDYCSYKNDKTSRESYRNTYKDLLKLLKK